MRSDIFCYRKPVITFKIVLVSKGYNYTTAHRYIIMYVTLSLLSKFA